MLDVVFINIQKIISACFTKVGSQQMNWTPIVQLLKTIGEVHPQRDPGHHGGKKAIQFGLRNTVRMNNCTIFNCEELPSRALFWNCSVRAILAAEENQNIAEGSVLWPLYSLYTYDTRIVELPNTDPNDLLVGTFANDTAILVRGKCIYAATDVLQLNLKTEDDLLFGTTYWM